MRIDEAARLLVNATFTPYGREDTRLDCVGVVVLALRKAEIIPLDFDFVYTMGTQVVEFEEKKLLKYLEQTDELTEGLVMVAEYTRKEVSHVAITTRLGEGFGIVHASQYIGRVIESRLDAKHFPPNARLYRPKL